MHLWMKTGICVDVLKSCLGGNTVPAEINFNSKQNMAVYCFSMRTHTHVSSLRHSILLWMGSHAYFISSIIALARLKFCESNTSQHEFLSLCFSLPFVLIFRYDLKNWLYWYRNTDQLTRSNFFLGDISRNIEIPIKNSVYTMKRALVGILII